MNIKIVRYVPSTSARVLAFIDVELDAWVRLNGLNYNRDGTLRSAQLTPWRNGKRLFFDAVSILDADLRELLVEDILGAMHAYVASLPPSERTRPPRVRAVPKASAVETVSNTRQSAGPKPTAKKALPPPGRPLAGAKGGRP